MKTHQNTLALNLIISLTALTATAQETHPKSPSKQTLVNHTTSKDDQVTEASEFYGTLSFFASKRPRLKGRSDGIESFAALPEKIDAIVDFQTGVNNSPEGLHDSFTLFLTDF